MVSLRRGLKPFFPRWLITMIIKALSLNQTSSKAERIFTLVAAITVGLYFDLFRDLVVRESFLANLTVRVVDE